MRHSNPLKTLSAILKATFLTFIATVSHAQFLVNCAPGVPCNSATGPANTNTGMPAWQAFGVLNGDFTALAPLFSIPTGDIIGNAGSGLAQIGLGSTLAMSAAGKLLTGQPIKAESGSTYTVLAGDAGYLITFSAASTVTLPDATTAGFGAGVTFELKNNSSGNVVVNRQTSSTINSLTSLTLGQQTSCVLVSDGTNYQTTSCTASAGAPQPMVVSDAPATSQNNYSPTGYVPGVTAQLILTPSAALSITGINAPATAADLYVYNASMTYSITFPHESGSSSAGNQFVGQNAAAMVLQPFSGAHLRLIPNLISSTAYWTFL
jgi:hypothetical protein